jgi:hypothetical protein
MPEEPTDIPDALVGAPATAWLTHLASRVRFKIKSANVWVEPALAPTGLKQWSIHIHRTGGNREVIAVVVEPRGDGEPGVCNLRVGPGDGKYIGLDPLNDLALGAIVTEAIARLVEAAKLLRPAAERYGSDSVVLLDEVVALWDSTVAITGGKRNRLDDDALMAVAALLVSRRTPSFKKAIVDSVPSLTDVQLSKWLERLKAGGWIQTERNKLPAPGEQLLRYGFPESLPAGVDFRLMREFGLAIGVSAVEELRELMRVEFSEFSRAR